MTGDNMTKVRLQPLQHLYELTTPRFSGLETTDRPLSSSTSPSGKTSPTKKDLVKQALLALYDRFFKYYGNYFTYFLDEKMPKLGKLLDNHAREIMEAELRNEEWKKDKRSVYCLTKHSGNWRTPIHKTIAKLKKKYGLGWLRTSENLPCT